MVFMKTVPFSKGTPKGGAAVEPRSSVQGDGCRLLGRCWIGESEFDAWVRTYRLSRSKWEYLTIDREV